MMRVYSCLTGAGLLISVAVSDRPGDLRAAAGVLTVLTGVSWTWRRGRERPRPAWLPSAWPAWAWPAWGWRAFVGAIVELVALALAPMAAPATTAALGVLFAVCMRHGLRSGWRRAAAAVSASVLSVAVGTIAAAVWLSAPVSAGLMVAPALGLVVTCAAVQLLTGALRTAATARTAERLLHTRLAAVVETSPAGMLLLDAAGYIRQVNAAAARLIGVPARRLTDQRFTEPAVTITLPDVWTAQRDAAAELINRARTGERLHEEPLRWVRPDGSTRHLAISTSTLPARTPSTPAPVHGGSSDTPAADVLVVISDVTERLALEHDLRDRALTDELTGLANRARLMDQLAQLLTPDAGDAARRGTHAVVLIDLDEFKTVNDTGGHAAGDQLLCRIAAQLRRAVRHTDTVARLSGDEFAVLLADTTAHDAEVVATALLEAVRTSLALPGGPRITLSGSLGLTVLPPGWTGSPDQALAEADLAMYSAKRGGRDRWARYAPSMREAVTDRLQLEGELQDALREGGITAHYQPYIDLATGRVLGVEALARWPHPTRGLRPPADFIPVAEDTGMIIPLGRLVLEQAVTQARAWQLTVPGAEELTVSVNLSVRQLADPDLVSVVAEALDRSGLPPHSLILELTESVLADSAPATTAVLHRLRTLGVQLAVDDFGTGFSALSYLQRFPLDVLKIDRSFVADLSAAGPCPITAAIVGLARSLSLRTIAEGIETADQAAALRALGCTAGQGYHYARPLPASAVTGLLSGPPVTWRPGHVVPAPRSGREGPRVVTSPAAV
jgi:diguanylate cyclase (GGDEF)-like protein/PAS domain S-box-containing protein